MNGPRRVYVIVGLVLLAALLIVLFGGCSMFGKRPKISGNGFSVVGPADAGKPATLDSGSSVASLPIPAGSSLVMTKTEAVRAIPATDQTAAVAAQPAKEVVEVKLAGATEWRKIESTVKADTGTVDTSIAKHRIDAAENRYLLFAAIGAAVAGGFFLYIKYPTPAMMCGVASVVFFLAWKLADLPDWFWGVGALAVGGGLFLYLGHRRGEADGVKAGLAGDVEPKNPPVVKTTP